MDPILAMSVCTNGHKPLLLQIYSIISLLATFNFQQLNTKII